MAEALGTHQERHEDGMTVSEIDRRLDQAAAAGHGEILSVGVEGAAEAESLEEDAVSSRSAVHTT